MHLKQTITTLTLALLLTACNAPHTTTTITSYQKYTLPNADLKTQTLINPPKFTQPAYIQFKLTRTPNLPDIAFHLPQTITNTNTNSKNKTTLIQKTIPLKNITPNNIVNHLYQTIHTNQSPSINANIHQQINDFNQNKTNFLFLIFQPSGKVNYKFTFKNKKLTTCTFTLTNQMPFYSYKTKAWLKNPITLNQAKQIFGHQGKSYSHSKSYSKTINLHKK